VAAVAGVGGVLLATGAPPALVTAGSVGYLAVTVAAWRSGGRYEFTARASRPLGPRDDPVLRRALLEVCERAGRPLPRLLVVEMDVPGAMVGYDGGEPVVAVDPLVVRVVGPEGVRALFAHELGHLGRDLHTDALRSLAPRAVGLGTFWVAALAGRGAAVATAGVAAFLVLAGASNPWLVRGRYVLGLGTELLALAASRYANRLEEYAADASAARIVEPGAVAEALYRVAAVATGDNDEDVAGPVPWEADRSLRFALFATHPSVEARVAALGCAIPAWVRPYRPGDSRETRESRAPTDARSPADAPRTSHRSETAETR
jgi:Zn-dependent protease with chaperone function